MCLGCQKKCLVGGFLENQASYECVWVSKERTSTPGSNIMHKSGFPVHPDPGKPDFLFFSIYWRTRLARRLLGVSRERPPGLNPMQAPGFLVHPDLEIWKYQIGVF